MAQEKPQPDVHDPLMAPFWSGLRDGTLMVQQCNSCGATHWPALPICPECLSEEQEWSPVEQKGRLWSYVVYHRALSPAFADDIPYTVGIVEVVGGIRFPGRLRGPSEGTQIGATCTAKFVEVSLELTMLEWDVVS